MNAKTHKVAIIGAGFAGRRAAAAIAGAGVEVTVFEPHETTVMLPALPDVAGGWVTSQLTATSLAGLLPPCVRHDRRAVRGVDLACREILTDDGPCVFDAILMASGSRAAPCPFNTPASVAYTVDTLACAVLLRDAFWRYLNETSQAHVIVVGGGYTGLELAASLAARARVEGKKCRVTVVELSAEVLPFLPPRQRSAVQTALAAAGVTIITGARVTAWDGHDVWVGEQRYKAVFFCWAVGSVFAIPEIHGDAVCLHDGRLTVAPDLSLPGYPGVFVAGDAAAFFHRGEPLRKAVNFAWYGGRIAGRNVRAYLRGTPTRPYRPSDLGWVIPLHTMAVGLLFGHLWVGGRLGLRLHYLMCGVRSPRFSRTAGFAKLALTLFKYKKEVTDESVAFRR